MDEGAARNEAAGDIRRRELGTRSTMTADPMLFLAIEFCDGSKLRYA